MADYAPSININDYVYMRRVYVTETSGQNRMNVLLRMVLDSSNFNFYFAREDGKDFRLCERSNGTGVLNMFIARWDYAKKKACLFFKIPFLAANEQKTLYAFWGNRLDLGISNLDSISECFLFCDDFNTFDGFKWSASSISGTAFTVGNSRIFIKEGQYIFPGGPGNFNNVLVGGTATASSQSGSDAPSRAADKNMSTRWTSANTPYPHWWKYDFGPTGAKIIKAVTVRQFINLDSGGRAFRIEGSDNDSDWTILYSGEMPYTSLCSTFSFPNNNTAYRYYRIFWLYGWVGNYVSVYEFEFSEVPLTEEKNNPFSRILGGKNSWILEEGLYGTSSTASTSAYTHALLFHDGTPSIWRPEEIGFSEFTMRFYFNDSINRRTNVVDGRTFVTYTGTIPAGFEKNSFNYNTIAYWAVTDYAYQGMQFRNTLPDYYDWWERSISGNTELASFWLLGAENWSANGTEIDWITLREYDLDIEPLYDISELYVDFEYVGQQPLDFITYGPDITSIDYFHGTTFSGADAYRISDNIVDNDLNVFLGNSLSGSITIDFGRYGEDLVSDQYDHFDNNHVLFFGAVKLSNKDLNPDGRNYWLCTSASGAWAAIDFGVEKCISAVCVSAVPTKLNGMIKDYVFYGSNKNPKFFPSDRQVLASGTLLKTAAPQMIYLDNTNNYRYYILEAARSYGGNIAVQEWRMYGPGPEGRRRTVAQIRLLPSTFDSNEQYFPKYIKFFGSNDGQNWTLLTPSGSLATNLDLQYPSYFKTYTPFFDDTYGRWQRISLSNDRAYTLYKLECVLNWGGPGAAIKIAEWELVERVDLEARTYRIMSGNSPIFTNVWPAEESTFEDPIFYATNDRFNMVGHFGLMKSSTISGSIDMLVRY